MTRGHRNRLLGIAELILLLVCLLSFLHVLARPLLENCQLICEGVPYQEGFGGQREGFVAKEALSKSNGALIVLIALLLDDILKLIADLSAALQAERGSAAPVGDEDVAAELLT